MAFFDDPIVLVLVVVLVIFLFGAGKIPKLARSIGEARREFDRGMKGQISNENPAPSMTTHPDAAVITNSQQDQNDPLFIAAKNEGIETTGKTKEQIASELSWKLNKK